MSTAAMLTAATERQTHGGGFSAGERAGSVGGNLRRMGGIGQMSVVVHGVSVGYVVFGRRRLGRKGEVQRHFYNMW